MICHSICNKLIYRVGKRMSNEGPWKLFFMPQTSKKLRGHIGLGLCVHLCVCLSILFCIWSRKIRDRILKFDIWDVLEK